MKLSKADAGYYRALMVVVESWQRLGVQVLPGGTRRIGHIPHRAPQAYLHDIFPGINEVQIRKLELKIGFVLPESLRSFYYLHNGMNLFGRFGVYGLRAHFDRTSFPSILEQPYDIGTPNIEERPGMAPKEVVFLGSLSEEKVLVFAWPDGSIGFWDEAVSKLTRKQYDSLLQYLAFAAEIADLQFDELGKYVGGDLFEVFE